MDLLEIAMKYYPKIESDIVRIKRHEMLETRYFLNGVGRKNKGSYSLSGLRKLIIAKKIEYIINHLGIKNIVRSRTSLSVYLYHKDLTIRISDHPKDKTDISVKGIDHSFIVLAVTDERDVLDRIKKLF